MLWATGYGSCSLFADLLLDVAVCAAGVYILWLGWLGDNAVEIRGTN